MRKIMLILLIMALLFVCATALAAGEQKSGLFTYTIKGNGTAIITNFDWETNGESDIYIPRMVDGYTVSEIGAMAFSSDNASLESPVGYKVVVIIPDTVTIIGEKAFFCTNIQIVQIPSSVEHIGEGAFAGCKNIEEHLVQKGNNNFAVIDGVLYNKGKKELVAYPYTSSAAIPDGIKAIGGYAFFGYRKTLSPRMMPDSITEIGNYAFAYCSFHLDDDYASVFSNVKHIGNYSFYCGRFTSSGDYGENFFKFSELEEIGDYSFYKTEIECSNSLYFPKATRMGAYAFYGCNLTGNKISKNDYAFRPSFVCPALAELGEYAFAEIVPGRIPYTDNYNRGKYYEPYIEIHLEESKLTEIPYRAFYNCSRLYVVNLPETCSTIGEEAFFGVNDNAGGYKRRMNNDGPANQYFGNGLLFNCTVDTKTGDCSYYLPKSIKTIGKGAFENARIDLVFEEGSLLETIGDRAFYGAYFADEKINIPGSVKTVGKEAFLNANNISCIYIPKSVESIGDSLCDRTAVKLDVEPDSYGALYASSNGYIVISEDNDTSWLND